MSFVAPFANAVNQNNPANWGLDRIDNRSVITDDVYSYTEDGTGVVIYVLDVFLDADNPEFGNRVLKQIRAVNMPSCGNSGCGGGTSTCPQSNDFNDLISYGSHGTHVAGIAAGTNFGVAKGASIVGVEVLKNCGDGTTGSPQTIIDGIEFAIKDRENRGFPPAVINLSLNNPPDTTVNAKVQEALTKGISVVISAGNNGQDACLYSPQAMGGPNSAAIVVGASDENDRRWTYELGGSNTGDCVDIYAPGANITSAVDYGDFSDSTSGTSQAAPFVTGRAALYLQKYPLASPADVKAAITTYSASHNRIQVQTNGETGNILYTKDDYDNAKTIVEFLQCGANSSANYLIEWNADYGPFEEYYTVETQIGSGSWQTISQNNTLAWGLTVYNGQQFRVRTQYQANGKSSTLSTGSWKTAPSCGGGGGFNPF